MCVCVCVCVCVFVCVCVYVRACVGVRYQYNKQTNLTIFLAASRCREWRCEDMLARAAIDSLCEDTYLAMVNKSLHIHM